MKIIYNLSFKSIYMTHKNTTKERTLQILNKQNLISKFECIIIIRRFYKINQIVYKIYVYVLIIIMMSTYKIKGTNQIKNCYLYMQQIQGFPQESVLKLSNNSNTFYSICHQNKQIKQSQSIEASKDFLTINKINQGYYKIECIPMQSIKQIKVIVSQRDWEIISQNKNLLENQFFNQAKVVWNQLKIPLYYKQTNYVILNCICPPGIWCLGQDSLLEIDFIPQVANEQKNEKKVQIFQLIQFEQQIQNGYDDYIIINQNQFKKGGYNKNSYYKIVSNDILWNCKIKSYQEFLKQKNSDQKNKISKSNQSWYVKLRPEKQVQAPVAYLTQFFHHSFNLPMSIKIDGQYIMDTEHIGLSNQIFVQQLNKVIIYFLDINESQESYQNYEEYIYEKIANEDIIFYNRKLIAVKKKYFLTWIQQFTKQNKLKQISSILIKKSSVLNLNKVKENLKKKIKFFDCRYYKNQINDQQKHKCHMLINKFRNQKYFKNKILNNSHIFQIFYKDQIKNILENISLGKNILITSSNKNGKTFLYHYLNKQNNVIYINFYLLNQPTYKLKQILEYLQTIFIINPNKIIYIDNVNSLCKNVPKDLHRQNQYVASRILSKKLKQFIELYCTKSCIMTTTNQEDMDPLLKNIQLFQVNLKNPTNEGRRIYFEKNVTQNKKIIFLLKNTQSLNFSQIIEKFSTKQKIQQFYEKQYSINVIHKQQVHNFSKIAGLQKAKNLIIQTIQSPSKYSFLYKNLPIKLPRGILLYGPSGVGKTYLATSVKQQLKMRFFEIKGSDILNKYIGASEQAVRDIFQRAMAVVPSIIFFDQFESIVPKRNQSNTGVTDRIVNQFLCYLDGVVSSEGVFIIAASSRPDMIDPALLRPGRIDKHIYLQYPNQIERGQILQIYKNSIIFESQREEIIKKTNNFSYSDMVGLIKQLRIKKASIQLKKQHKNPQQFKKISTQFFNQIREKYKISTNIHQQQRLSKIYEKFSKGSSQQDIKNQKSILF